MHEAGGRERAQIVIAVVNHRMPRSLGDSFIHVSRLTHIVEIDQPIVEVPQGQPGEVAQAIGQQHRGPVEDGATMQMGIGEIPDAVLLYLKDKRDLGVHTEMFSDGVIDLIEAGVVTSAAKTIHRGKIVASFALGSKRIFDYLDNNPLFEFHPQDYVNDPFVIAQNKKMVAINSALEVDLTGQVCADSIGRSIYSGVGGPGRLRARRLALARRQADHRTALDGEGRRDLAHLRRARPRLGCRHEPRRRALRGDGVRCREPARQVGS